ncbi:MAG: PTS sugar transporter subunit IIA, partial [Oxalobacter sp.]
MTTPLSRILPQENIVLDLSVQDKQDLFHQLGQLFGQSDNIDANAATTAIAEREAAGSTGLGCGVAVPHGRITSLIGASAAFIRLAEPIPFDSPDGKPVRLVIAL